MSTKRVKNGKFEYIIKRSKILKKPIYFSTVDEEYGDAYAAKVEAMLDAGIIPAEFGGEGSQEIFLAELIKSYITNVSVPETDKKLLMVLYGRIGKTPIKTIDYKWVEAWILEMKVVLNIAPGTIRHYVGALRRCFDYAGRQNIVSLIINPIRQLPVRYARYTDKDNRLTEQYDNSHKGKEDDSRDRRLDDPEEEARIRAVMRRENLAKRERPLDMRYQAALQLLFEIALESAMRMREIYTLTLDQISIEKATIFLEKTKNGNKRQVPLTTPAIAAINTYMECVVSGKDGMEEFSFEGERLFPWWNGDSDYASLAKLTVKLSKQFNTIFDAAMVENFRFHDLRHEAISRIYEKTDLTDVEIMKITGHSSTRALARYANLRASKLAKRLW